jgi:hypothetical protein
MSMAPIPALEHINPDAMAPADLAKVARELRRLAHYCEVKASAMRERVCGELAAAQDAENFADALYKKLPPEWRW